MIIDCHVHLSDRPDPVWRKSTVPFDAERLLRHMEGPYLLGGKSVRVDVSVVQPAVGETLYQPGGREVYRKQHEYVVRAVREHPKRLIGCMTFNPRINVEEGIEELERLVREEGFRAVKLHPNMHLYRPDLSPDLLNPIIEASLRLKIPIFIHTGDTPFSIPSQLLPSIERYPDANFVLFHFGVQTVGFPYEAMHIARRNENVYLELSWAPLPRIREALHLIGADKLIYGSDAPALEQGALIRLVDALCDEPPIGVRLSEEERDKILGGNIARLLGIDTKAYG